jgi:Flp pilus assembly protein TadB
VKADLADPVADRVVEALRTLHQKGTSAIALDILDDLIETTADDVRQVESLYTAEFELRVQAAVVPVLPFVVLAALCAGNSGFRSFYTTRAGAFVVCLGVAMALVGWYAIQWLGRLPAEQRVFTGVSAVQEAAR